MRTRSLVFLALVSVLVFLAVAGCGSGGAGAEADLVEDAWVELTEADLEIHEEARSYLANTSNIVWSENFELDVLRRFIEDLYTAGAERVVFAGIEEIDGSRISGWVVVQLPSDPAARGRVFAKYNEVYGQYVYEPGGLEDEGQVYIDIALD